VTPPLSGRLAPGGLCAVTVYLRPPNRPHVGTDARAGTALLDTGADFSAVFEGFLRPLLPLPEQEGVLLTHRGSRRRRKVVVVTMTIQADATAPLFDLGRVRLAVLEGVDGAGIDVLLGADAMDGGRLKVDWARRDFQFTPPPPR
jgi:hypothetical protein